MTSTRLPGKVLAECLGRPMLELMIERLQRVPSLDGIIVATTTNHDDDPVVELAQRLGVSCFRGSENDVLGRVLGAAESNRADVIVETTGDCPCIDPAIVELCIQSYLQGDADYVSNVLERTYPVGMDTQVFATTILADVARRTTNPVDREHVSLFIYRNPSLYRLQNVSAPAALHAPDIHITLDTPQDLILIRGIFEMLYPTKPAFALADILQLLQTNPGLRAVNRAVQRKVV